MARRTISKSAKLSVSIIALTSLAFADAAMAQNNDDEIVVTARRQAETLIEVPLAVAAFDESAIEDLGLRSIDDVARHTAGFSFSNAFGRTTERPVIRGAANILAGVQFGVEAGAAYFVDGVYYSGDMQAIDTRGLERVEVIKGAQSALYGRNTYSGAINFITKRPSQNGFEGSVEALAAEDGEFEFYGRVSNSFADNRLGYSISGRYYEYGGDKEWVNAAIGGAELGEEQSFNVNGVLDVNFNDNVSLITRLGYTSDDDGPRPFRLIGAEQNNCFPGYRSGAFYDPNGGFPFPTPFGGIFPASTLDNSNWQYFCGSLTQFEDLNPAQETNGVPFVGVERELIFSTTKFEANMDNGWQFQAQMGLRKQDLETGSDSDHLPGTLFHIPISPFFSIPTANGFLNASGQQESTDYSGEIRLRSPADRRMRASIGAFYYDFEEDGFTYTLANVSPTNPRGVTPLEDTRSVKNKAVFATLDIDITEQLELSLEGRYQDESKGLVEYGNGPAGAPTYNEDGSFDNFIPKAILSYDFAGGASAYASYAKGVKPGGINGPIGAPTGNEFYDPETSNAFEIGYKSNFPDGNGQVTIAAYYNDISKYQLTTPVAQVGSGNVNSVATNQGDAEIMGVEIETSYDISDYITIGGSYAWTDAEFTSGCDDFQFTLNSGGFLLHPFDQSNPPETGTIRNPGALGDPTAGFTTPPSDPNGLFTGNLSCSIAGNTIPMTSEHQASLYGQFEAPITSEMDFFANADFTYESSKFVQVHNGIETGSTSIVGAQMGIKYGNARFEIFGRNLLDERTPPIATRWFDLFEGFNTVPSALGGSIDRSLVGPRSTFISYRRGRQIGVRGSFDF